MRGNGLAPADFAAFFKALWGFDPFPWQERLVFRLATGEDAHHNYRGDAGQWPDVLDLPTGSGKTAALDIAVFHLALEASKGVDRRAPLRIVFVVDRRLIVDDAYGRAKALADKLRDAIITPATADPIVLKVARALRDLSGLEQPLLVRSLRGGAPLEDDWARTPVQPTILCSTVDQVGSRLLFRGYGVSDRMKPIHAGLLGSDCLILLDEAHLSEPFRQTLDWIEDLRGPDKERTPFGFAVLTATPSQKAEHSFALSDDDHAHPLLSRRLQASKPTRLIEIIGKRGIEAEARRTEVIAEEAMTVVEMLKTNIAHPAVGVVVNRVARARAVFERLNSQLNGAANIILLIGPARAVDRDRHAENLDPIRTRQPDAPRSLGKPLVVVATQTIEAGVDIDFDGLVTEAAAFDALRQRFGRLNRAGRPIRPEAVVLAHKDDIGAKADDAVYGDRIKTTWEVLSRWKANAPDDRIDFGIGSTENTLRNEAEPVANLVAKTMDAPVLMPAYADLWAQTCPIPNSDPEIALFLHGPDRSQASVQIVWRADVEPEDFRRARHRGADRLRLVELFALVPPRAAEAVEVPLWAARAWLNQPSVMQSDFSDAVGGKPQLTEEQEGSRAAFRWAGEENDRSGIVHGRELRNGDLIVVPTRYGGCDEWGWNPEANAPVTDVADNAAWPYRARRFSFRITPELIAQGLRAEGSEVAPSLAARLTEKLAEHENDRAKDILAAVREFELPTQMHVRVDMLERTRRQLKRAFVYPRNAEELPRGVVIVAPRGIEAAKTNVGATEARGDGWRDAENELAAVPATESEELGADSDDSVPLVDHSQHVRAWAESFVARAGLKAYESADIVLAASLHDTGKADARYQAYYAGGSPYGADAEKVLAKSGRGRLPRGAWGRSGLPPDWRHESLSVRLALIHPEFERANDPELVLWLIGTHHGYGRPLFPHADAKDAERRPNLLRAFGITSDLPPGPGPQAFAFDFRGFDWAQIFERLKCRYGIWGLARFEAFVRLADHRASDERSPPEAARPYKEAAE